MIRRRCSVFGIKQTPNAVAEAGLTQRRFSLVKNAKPMAHASTSSGGAMESRAKLAINTNGIGALATRCDDVLSTWDCLMFHNRFAILSDIKLNSCIIGKTLLWNT
jgi:hypothetical protein